MGKASSLRPIAEDANGFVKDRLTHEGRDNHTVATCLTRPDCIKKPYNDHRQMLLGKVSECQKLIYGFRFGVSPSRLGGGPHDAVIIFPECRLLTLAINLRRRGNQKRLSVAARIS